MSSEDRGETTGDSPSRLMCTDNSNDWRDTQREVKCLLYVDDILSTVMMIRAEPVLV